MVVGLAFLMLLTVREVVACPGGTYWELATWWVAHMREESCSKTLVPPESPFDMSMKAVL